MFYQNLNDSNFLNYAMRSYNNPSCMSVDEFENDLKIPLYISRSFSKKELKERLILNNIIVFLNVFGNDAGIKMLYFKVRKVHHATLTTFLKFLNRNPEFILAPYSVPEVNTSLMERLKESTAS